MTQEVLVAEERGEDSMAARDISYEAIIALVHARPELWDPECPGYADRVLKRSKWEEVYKFVTPNWDEMSATDQDNRGKEVYTRWRSLRDRYKKEVNEEKSAERSGAPSTRRRPNPHAESLSFLRRTTEMRPAVSSVPARAIARRASSSPENTETSQETIPETISSQEYQEPPEPQGNFDKRARSTSATPRPRQQETPFEDYFNRIIAEMKKQSQNDAKKDDEFLNISDPDVIFLRMLLCVLREIPPEKRTDVRGDIHAYLTYIVGACKEQRPYPKFQPWALGFNSPSGSFSQPMPSHECRDTTPVTNSYAGPPPTYTPFPSYPGFQRMHGQPHPVSSPSSTQSVQHRDVGSEPNTSTLRSSYPVCENL